MKTDDWQPNAYLTFADLRVRPAIELLRRVQVEAPSMVVDLGCGTGSLARLAHARWPKARILALDSSGAMLPRALADTHHPLITWRQADLTTWAPAGRAECPDVILSNAALHWVGDHDHLFPRLLRTLKPGGVLAVQMPRNHDRPSHALIRAVGAEGPWADRVADLVAAPPPVDAPEVYLRRLFEAGASEVDCWETDYHQILDGGPERIADFTASTALRPWLERLASDEECMAFMRAYTARLTETCPSLSPGRTVFPFRRLFLVARAPETEAGR